MNESYGRSGNADSAQAMHKTNQLAHSLQKNGLKVMSAREIEYGNQIRLECGAIINLFDTGTVTVQGKLDPRTKAETVHLLQQILPSHAIFPPSMVPKAKMLVPRPGGYVVNDVTAWSAPDEKPRIAWEPRQSTQGRTVKALPNLMIDELGEYVSEELRQVREDTGEPYERW